MKTIYILIGPKGSGKSYIGRLLEKEFKIRFLSVEPYFLHVANDAEVLDEKSFTETWERVEKEISKHFKNNDKIIFESTGTFDSFKIFLKRLQSKYKVKLIKIEAPLDICFERYKKRSVSDHVPMSEKLVERINRIAVREKYPFDIVIDNTKISNREIINEFYKLLENEKRKK